MSAPATRQFFVGGNWKCVRRRGHSALRWRSLPDNRCHSISDRSCSCSLLSLPCACVHFCVMLSERHPRVHHRAHQQAQQGRGAQKRRSVITPTDHRSQRELITRIRSSLVILLQLSLCHCCCCPSAVVVAPTFLHIDLVQRLLDNPSIEVSAQNCVQFKSGAYTGELSADIIKEYGGIPWVRVDMRHARCLFVCFFAEFIMRMPPSQ